MKDLRRIAIVNRGEPAMRFLRALREYNLEHDTALEAVALYTDPDEDSPFVRLADDTVHLGPAMRPGADGAMVSAYVHHEALLAALKRAKCDAVWPGWGFVSEDPTFVAKLETAGITFLGPSAKAMYMLGDKIAAKELAEQCEVPLAPWAKLDLEDDAITLAEKAREVGYPLMVKASAGGGGRGIRRVNKPSQLAPSVAEVRDEVKKVFGQGAVFIERCISGARHIEVQLVVGADGKATALGIRDCSIQRRNQKIIEEAPSPVVPAKTVARLGVASARLAEAAGYRGVATAEYLYDPAKDRATFLEVNSRLQVEHTVTECITGCDLVQAQIAIARGLPWEKPVGPPRGHAIEVRLNAEDPEQGFAPRPGHIRVLRPPSGPGVRFDSGVAEGLVVAPEFDSMIAKVIATGSTRKQAIARLERALRELQVVVEDGATNKAFLLDLLREPAFLDGSADTAWLDRQMEAGGVLETRHHFEALLFAAIVEYRRRRHGHIHEFFAQTQNGVPQHPPMPEPLTVDLKLRGQAVGLSVYGLADDKYLVGQPGALHLLTAESTGAHSAVLHLNGRRHAVMYAYGRTGIGVEIDGAMHTVELASGGTIKAPVPAMVVHVAVKEGDRVKAGDRLLTLEAMKLEMPLFAPEAGVVRAVLCSTNQQLTVGQDIIVLDPEGSEADTPAVVSRETLPAPTCGPLQQLFHGDFPSLVEIDEMDDAEATPYVDAVLTGIRLMFLGFDTDEMLWASLGVLLSAATSTELAELTHPERWERLATLPAVYADTGALFDRSLTAGGSATSAQMSFYAMCRRHQEGEDAVPEAFLPLLKRGLRHYAVHSLEPDADLREALWRLAIVHAHSRARHRLCSQLLRTVVSLRDAGVAVERHHRLREALARITRILSVKQAFVADNARQALYVLFRQNRYLHRQAEVEARIDADLQLTREAKAGAESPEVRARISELVLETDSLLPMLVERADPDDKATPATVEVMIRRMYSGQSCEPLGVVPTQGTELAAFAWAVRVDEDTLPLLVAVGRADAAERCIAQASSRSVATKLPEGHATELFLAGPPTHLDEAALTAAVEAVSTKGFAGSSRLTVTWLNGRGIRHLTWLREGGALTEQRLLRDIHPEHARRFELQRLSEFDLDPLETPEGIAAFRGTARTNPRDERVFVFASVRAVDPSLRDGMWNLERAFFEGVRVLRDVQADRSHRNKFQWNRLTIYIRQPLRATKNDIRQIAMRLEGPTRTLGLEKVVIRCALLQGPGQGVPKEYAVVVSKPSGHRLELTLHEPSLRPVRALTDYQLNVIKARRLGYVYPYEIARMLEGRVPGGEPPHPDMAKGRFVEHDLDETGETLVPVERVAGQNSAAVVVGIIDNITPKHPEGMPRVWIAADPTMAMCALAEPECRRIIAALRLARELGLPVEWLSVSAGAKIAMDSGTENLDWTARVLKEIVEFTQDGGAIHIIVTGVNVGAQSYWNAEATMLMHTRGLLIMTADGSMVLTGKKALEVSGGVAAEDELGIGGFERIMGPNGQAQMFAQDLGEAYALLFEHYRVSYHGQFEKGPRRLTTRDPVDRSVLNSPYTVAEDGFKTVGEIFDPATNPGRKKPFAIREVMGAVIDGDGGCQERFRTVQNAETAVIWDVHVGGWPVCLIGFESKPLPRRGRIPMDGPGAWSGGTLFPNSSKKVARALNAASGNRPVVVLANLSGFDGSPESLRLLQLEYGAEIGRAVVNFDGPIVFVVVGRYHGGAYVVFSKALNPQLRALALEGSFASVIGGGPAAAVVFPRVVRRLAEADPRLIQAREALASAKPKDKPKLRERLQKVENEVTLDKQGDVAAEFDAIHTVERAVEVGSLDAVIAASDLRPAIIEQLTEALR